MLSNEKTISQADVVEIFKESVDEWDLVSKLTGLSREALVHEVCKGKSIIKALNGCKWNEGDDQSCEGKYKRAHFMAEEYPEGVYEKLKDQFWSTREKNKADEEDDSIVTEVYITIYDHIPEYPYIQIEITHCNDEPEILVYDESIYDDDPEYWKKLRDAAMELFQGTRHSV